MELFLYRKQLTPKFTLGELFTGTNFFCFTLEDTVRPAGEKVYGETAIPAGRYEVIINWSNKYKRRMPLLLNVPNFTGVRIHSGNRPEDSEGCILVGSQMGDGVVMQSKATFARFFDWLEKALLTDKVYITIQ